MHTCSSLSADDLRQQQRQACTDHEVSADNPHSIVQCRDIDTSMTATAADGDRLTLTFESTSGGYKVYQLGTSAPQTALFSGVTSRQSLDVVFDLEPPAHCSADSTCDYDDQPALEIYPDGTKVRKQTVWSADDVNLLYFLYCNNLHTVCGTYTMVHSLILLILASNLKPSCCSNRYQRMNCCMLQLMKHVSLFSYQCHCWHPC